MLVAKFISTYSSINATSSFLIINNHLNNDKIRVDLFCKNKLSQCRSMKRFKKIIYNSNKSSTVLFIALIKLELMVPNIIETANATDFITSQGIHRLFAPNIF